MKGFDYYRPATVKEAVSLLARHGDKASLIAGGSDMLAMMKDRVEGPKLKSPVHLIDIKGIDGLAHIRQEKDVLRIGAAATLTDIAESPLVRDRLPVLAQAAQHVAVPQIRNVGTIGGNLCQRPRCWYFRGRAFKDCLRKGGGNCYAFDGENQYHAIFPAGACAMVSPSDTAVALTALGASVEIEGPKGKRTVPVGQFYVDPDADVLSETVLGAAEMVTAVEAPLQPAAGRGVFMKLTEREAFDFALVSVAVVLAMQNGLVTDARIAFGGLASRPLRAPSAEAALMGKKVADAAPAACAASIEKAKPLSNNGYKAKAARGLLQQALASLA